MFAVIDVNGATHVVINIPHQGSDKSLPAIAAMLEQNTTFIKKGWNELSTVKSKMSIILGETYRIGDSDQEMIINSSTQVIGEEFVVATPEVFINNAKAIEKKDNEIAKLRTELNFIKLESERFKEQVAALTNNNESQS